MRWPAEIAIAGDTNVNKGTTITYSSFRGAIDRNDANAVGKIVNAGISWTGFLDFDHGGPAYYNYDRFNVKDVYYEAITQHNIPDVFWRFLIANGPVVENGTVVNRQINDPYFYATGLPISDAYWSSVVINGQPRTVLVQAYERRVLTYVPDNPEGFKVEMGNVGLHYYDWRYKDVGKPDALAGLCQQNPTLGFGNLYNNNTLVKIQLGCAQAGEERSTVAYQPFQHGAMLATTRFDFYSGWTYEDIFVMFSDGTVKTFPFIHNNQIFDLPTPTPEPGNPPAPLPTPPPGLFAPERNFATVWSNTSSVNMLERLGWATGPAQVIRTQKNAQGSIVPGTGGAIQLFQGGMMVYPNVPALDKKIVVLYNASGYAYIVAGPHNTYINVDHYNTYDDTFQPR
jgi:hypothetical protein